MKIKWFVLFFILISGISSAQNPDSLRQAIKGMSFDIPCLSPVPASVTAKVVNNQIKLEVENRYNLINLKELKITLSAGSQVFPVRADIAPLNKGIINIDLPHSGNAENMLLTFTDPRGFVCHQQIIQPGSEAKVNASKVKIEVAFSESGKFFTIKSEKPTFIINKINGTFDCITSGGDTVITNGGGIMLVPFNNDDGGAPKIAGNNYTQDIQPIDYKPVEIYKADSVILAKNAGGSLKISLSGSIENKLEGTQDYIFNPDGTSTVSYDYKTLVEFAEKNLLRQFGLLLTLPQTFDLLSRERRGLWTVYPESDINRLKGFVRALPLDKKFVETPLAVPANEWKDNSNRLGTNDFKSTKDHFLRASLKNDKDLELMVQSDGSQSACSWIDGRKTRFLVASLNEPGSCGFFTEPRPVFKKGDHINGTFTLSLH